jgi:hypothetical protein
MSRFLRVGRDVAVAIIELRSDSATTVGDT